MPRKPRVEYCGAFYHVITRGIQRQNLFHNNQDREFYLDRLEQYRKRYGFTIYAYVLMSNHVHLLVESAKAPLSKIMQGLQFSYTRYFNRRYRKMGHLFQGRYRAILCDREQYLFGVGALYSSQSGANEAGGCGGGTSLEQSPCIFGESQPGPGRYGAGVRAVW